MIRRQCTREYKIDPIRKWIRHELVGLKPRRRFPSDVVVRQWFGITADEAQRAKSPDLPWSRHVYPFLGIELDPDCHATDLDMPSWKRSDCIRWFEDRHHGRHLPRSACIGCPYRSDAEWRALRDQDADEFKDACRFDESVRTMEALDGQAFVHRSLRPLRDVDLSTDVERGQTLLFGEECEGMCGV